MSSDRKSNQLFIGEEPFRYQKRLKNLRKVWGFFWWEEWTIKQNKLCKQYLKKEEIFLRRCIVILSGFCSHGAQYN